MAREKWAQSLWMLCLLYTWNFYWKHNKWSINNNYFRNNMISHLWISDFPAENRILWILVKQATDILPGKKRGMMWYPTGPSNERMWELIWVTRLAVSTLPEEMNIQHSRQKWCPLKLEIWNSFFLKAYSATLKLGTLHSHTTHTNKIYYGLCSNGTHN
jgi:hypothetical protein